MFASPHNNGDTKATFRSEGRRLNGAALDVEHVLNEFGASVLHGRNYQHCAEPNRCRDEDRERLVKIAAAIEDLKNLSIECFQKGAE